MTYQVNEFVYGITSDQIIEELREEDLEMFLSGSHEISELCEDVFIHYDTAGGDISFVAGTQVANSVDCYEGNKGGRLLAGITKRLSREEEEEIRSKVLAAIVETRTYLIDNPERYEGQIEYDEASFRVLDMIENLIFEGKMDYAVLMSAS